MTLAVKGLRKTYGSIVAINNLSFSIGENSIHGLVGPNGSGKTTTFKSILGLTIPDSGEILLDGESLLGKKGYRLRGRIGFSPETIALPSWLTVEDFLYLTAKLDGLSKRGSEQLAEKAIEEFGLEELGNTSISKLSKGQKKRVLIAQALIQDKQVYLLDEPMTGLDPEWVIRIREILREKARQGSSIIVSSHLLRELETLIDSVTIIKYGVVLFTGKIGDLASAVGMIGIKVSIEVDDPKRGLNILEKFGLENIRIDDGKIEVSVRSKDKINSIIENLVEGGVRVYQVSTSEAGLEDAYVKLLRRSRLLGKP
ncbi:MAG: ABC transporter ATP-binding protein [Desulfurococcales archaeon]|nr:ABC transporter ATP-binding protein [Desulfurococcales archaeon]